MDYSLFFAVFVIAGMLGIIGEIRSMRRQLASQLESIQNVLAEIRDAGKAK